MRRVADAREPPVVIPIVVVLVDVHVALVVPVAERGEVYDKPSRSPPLKYSWGCISRRIIMRQLITPSIFIFYEVSTYTTLSASLNANILNVWILGSAAGNLDRPHLPTAILNTKSNSRN
ncbi:MAG: hypothetical protein Q8Q22_01235 [bacterium]|nr:hypothetical protein [bacterium]